jgi:hypothetical protein
MGGSWGRIDYGMPAYFVQVNYFDTNSDVVSDIMIEDNEFPGKDRLEVLNIILLDIVLSIPIFIAGYLWAKSKQEKPNQGVDPTLTDAF